MPRRLPLIPPDMLTHEQKALYDRNRERTARGFTSFKAVREEVSITLNAFDVPSEADD